MSLLIRSLTNSSSVNTIDLGIAGFDPTESLVIAPSATLDLLTVMTADSLHAMQAQLASLVAAGEASVAATIDSSLLYPGAMFPQVAAKLDILGNHADITNTTLLTPAVSGLYAISVYVVNPTAAGGSDAAPAFFVAWNDGHYGQQTYAFTPLNTNTAPQNGTLPVWAAAGTPIQFWTTGGVYSTSLTYDFHFVVEAL
jgi:hypothetical protein